VLGVTYLVLFLTFRSFFIPLKAVIVNVLSLTASFGAMVWVFQDGNLSGLLSFTPLGFVDATVPILMFCTIFGVSMDYEVFLLSRIREAYEHGESNTASVAKGLGATASIITSAAAIIVIVTGAFAFTGITTTKAIGLGLAVAVFVDATIIRVLLVPATMRILGDWNWWPGGRKKSLFKEQAPAEPTHETHPSQNDPGHQGEQRRVDERGLVRRLEGRDERRGADGDRDLKVDHTRQEGRHITHPERQSGRRPRPGRAHLDSLRRLDRELRRTVESADGEQYGPENNGRVYRYGRASQE
jgi:RND superfamily putative drug exporter